MNRRRALTALLFLAARPVAVLAQSHMPTVGLLWIKQADVTPYMTMLLQGLREHGYVADRNIRLDNRFLVDDYEQLPNAAQRLVAAKPDVILTYGATSVQAVYKTTRTIPIVMIAGGDPIKLGVVKSLSRPQTNVTGLTSMTVDVSAKRLELLKEAFPKIRRVAVVLYPLSGGEVVAAKNYEIAASGMGIQTSRVEIQTANDIRPAIGSIGRLGADAIAVVGSTLLRANCATVVQAVAETRLPAIYVDDLFTNAGGLISYGASVAENFQRVAVYIDRLLKGAQPGDLPIEQPTRIELIINLKTAKAQGLTIPRTMALRADRVIE
jgi:putative tryptophan/tyrosine transport system substrate-binding protein